MLLVLTNSNTTGAIFHKGYPQRGREGFTKLAYLSARFYPLLHSEEGAETSRQRLGKKGFGKNRIYADREGKPEGVQAEAVETRPQSC